MMRSTGRGMPSNQSRAYPIFPPSLMYLSMSFITLEDRRPREGCVYGAPRTSRLSGAPATPTSRGSGREGAGEGHIDQEQGVVTIRSLSHRRAIGTDDQGATDAFSPSPGARSDRADI